MEGPGLSSQGAPQTLSRSFAHRSKQNLPDGCSPVFTTQAELGLEETLLLPPTHPREETEALSPPGRATDTTSALPRLSARSP